MPSSNYSSYDREQQQKGYKIWPYLSFDSIPFVPMKKKQCIFPQLFLCEYVSVFRRLKKGWETTQLLLTRKEAAGDIPQELVVRTGDYKEDKDLRNRPKYALGPTIETVTVLKGTWERWRRNSKWGRWGVLPKQAPLMNGHCKDKNLKRAYLK